MLRQNNQFNIYCRLVWRVVQILLSERNIVFFCVSNGLAFCAVYDFYLNISISLLWDCLAWVHLVECGWWAKYICHTRPVKLSVAWIEANLNEHGAVVFKKKNRTFNFTRGRSMSPIICLSNTITYYCPLRTVPSHTHEPSLTILFCNYYV